MIIRTVAIAALLLTGPLAMAETRLINLEEAAEVMQLEIRLQSATQGVVYARVCDQCELMRLQLDSDTRIRQGRIPLSLEQAARIDDRGATLLFDPKTQRVTRVIFWK